MKKTTLVKQRDITDCGAACLASISSHYELQVPVSKIRQLAGTDKKGTNALGMIEAAEKLGFSAKGVKGDTLSLHDLPTPTIAHVIIKKSLHHYVVIYKSSEKEIKVMDPAIGEIVSYSITDFAEIWSGVLILLTPSQQFVKVNENVSINSRFWFLLKPHKSIIIQSIIGAIIFTLIGLTSAIYVQKIIDFVIPSGNLLNLLSLGMIVLLIIQVLVSVFKSIFILKTGQQIDAKLILGYYKHLLTLPQRFFDTMRVGEVISRINDAVKIRTFINEVGIDILINCFVLLFSFVLMFTYYWKLALTTLLIVPFYLAIFWITNKLNKKAERRVMESAADLESQLVESLNNIKTIKAFGINDMANLKTETKFVSLLSAVYQSSMNGIFSTSSSLVISRFFTIAILWVGTGYVLDQTISPGELMSFYAIVGYFTGPVGSLISANKIYQNARIAADRLFEIMDLDGSANEKGLMADPHQLGDIVFKNVQFRYGTRTNVFKDLNLTIHQGKITAIIGESGSGKSTIASIIKRTYPVGEGKVFIGNYDLSHLDESSINDLIGIVPQHIELFAGSVIENIALGPYQPDTIRIMQIAEEIGAIDFINELPSGLQSYLGENGLNLSGGQRQRLAIIRTLYADPEVIIFDEATSALDLHSEQLITKTMKTLRDRGKTVIVITHREGAAVEADEVLLLDKGKILAQGAHQELIESNIHYQKYWERVTLPNYHS